MTGALRLGSGQAPSTTLGTSLRLYLPLLLLGAGAGLVHALGRRCQDPRRRRLYDILWIALLLAGAPAWLLVAAALGWV